VDQGVEAAIARQTVIAAEARIGEAISYALPQVDIVGTYSRNLKRPVLFFETEPGGPTESIEIGEDNVFTGTASLRQIIWGSGRLKAGYNAAKEGAAAARYSGDDAAASIARGVKGSYYVVLLAAEQTEIAQRSLEQAEKNVEQISARVRNGVTPEFDKLRAEVTVANRQAFLTRARNAEVVASMSLKRLLGIDLDRAVTLTDSLEFSAYDELQEDVVSHALESRRDLSAVRKEAAAAGHRRRLESRSTWPVLAFDANLSWQGQTSADFLPDERESAQSAALGLTLSWPIFDGRRTHSRTQQADAALRSLRFREQQLEDIVRLEVRSNWNDVRSISEEIVGSRQAVDVAGEAYSIAQVRYDRGMSTLVELLDSELALIQAALTLSETLYRYNVALAELEYSIGKGPVLNKPAGEDK